MTSSNVFANGANQNCGNVITDRSSTRIHHAPGGASSMASILSDGTSGGMFDSRPPTGKPTAYAQPQQSPPMPRQMTPQQKYAEELRLQIEEKNASKGIQKSAAFQAERADEARVQREAADLRAEFDREIEKQRQREALVDQRMNQHANYLAQEDCSKGDSRGGYGHAEQRKENFNQANTFEGARPTTKESVSSNRFASGANQNCGNIITDRPTTRVHQAPGGRSQIVLG
mmetsp:Transcript_106043/g.167470  ORF Transcript_106043/g.167470 Transcript_106043/m.167470 type:complete len:230 (-) Transcript_106043:93-782(-)